ncbi:MAG TPA: choice-of-anchor tandem repeat GloVer-containing protein [Ideonella sp.]|uniref:choice-of-anchor tandem repeat GloVer-containing protein n=1 Tax=Ideonella sp. TaxID=1929293 RepID=UPI002D0EC747|nr:choice-of-anchor tandem repeat GloVer-containing protein [Ideonella sp.]HSI49197.1 choice-of-anchor tandem repeat GloVer-containing protein [Ideonella sp.]
MFHTASKAPTFYPRNTARLSTHLRALTLASTVALGLLMPGVSAWANEASVISDFTATTFGTAPLGRLLVSKTNTLYGVASDDGPYGLGTVYELFQPDGVHWARKLIYAFETTAAGKQPSAGLIKDKKGNLYGVTAQGGAWGKGTVYKLALNADGSFTHSVLYSFQGSADGSQPVSELVFDAEGNLYGTAALNGEHGQGTAFKLIAKKNGWKFALLHGFTGTDGDGKSPSGQLVVDSAGAVYGTTVAGGTYNFGVVYKLTPGEKNVYAESIVLTFRGDNGFNPVGGLATDASGALYGTSTAAGPNGGGTLFKLAPVGDGSFTYSMLHAFAGSGQGWQPYGAVMPTDNGIFYGTTAAGGSANAGVVYQLAPSDDGSYKYSVIYDMGIAGNGSYAGLARIKSELFGTMMYANDSWNGGVFEVNRKK